MSAAHERRISAAQLRLRTRHPFFATLALFAPLRFTESVPTAATDGKDLFFNPLFLDSLDDARLDGLLVHEILHAALLHPTRRGPREPQRWNIACDIVVNGMARESGLVLPDGAVEYPPWAALQAEEIYERLMHSPPRQTLTLELADVLPPSMTQGDAGAEGAEAHAPLSEEHRAAIEAHWRSAVNQARVVATRAAERSQGYSPAGHSLEWGAVNAPQLDWRSLLWRHLVRTPTDFSGFDRRFVGRGLYLDAMEGETVSVAVCIDTSGSVGRHELGMFLGEVEGILGAYPHVYCDLFFCDSELDGPHPLRAGDEPPKPTGGGGTSFVPFFRWLAAHPPDQGCSERLAVYLTDGYGDFPSAAPEEDVLWVVVPGGRASREFPFGGVGRLGTY
jgi:predicted metal-dependent peptidase